MLVLSGPDGPLLRDKKTKTLLSQNTFVHWDKSGNIHSCGATQSWQERPCPLVICQHIPALLTKTLSVAPTAHFAVRFGLPSKAHSHQQLPCAGLSLPGTLCKSRGIAVVLMLSLWFECILPLHSSEVKGFFKKILHKALKVRLCRPAGVCCAARRFLPYLCARRGRWQPLQCKKCIAAIHRILFTYSLHPRIIYTANRKQE